VERGARTGSEVREDEFGRLSRGGDLVVNEVTGERVVTLIGSGDGRGDRLAADLRVGVPSAPHYHPSLTERFRVVAGRLEALLDDERRALEAGADMTIPPGMVHDWWNAGDEEARVLVEVTPGRRFEIMVTTLFGLANDGKGNDKGLPGPTQLALIAREFSDIVRFIKPPPLVQSVLFPLLAAIGRARGYRGFYPRYLEPTGHEEPDPAMLALVE
jgi:mannose-6-phosphate isomerase-like protein (cupin superfamily)